MIRTHHLCMYLGICEVCFQSLGTYEIVDTPPCVVLSCPESIRPPRIDVSLIRVEVTESVNKSAIQQTCELLTLLVCETSIAAIGLWVLDIDFLVRHIHISTHDDWFLSIELVQIVLEVTLPGHSIIQPFQSILGIRCIDRYEVEVGHLQSDDTSLMIVFLHPDTIRHVEWGVAGEDSRT